MRSRTQTVDRSRRHMRRNVEPFAGEYGAGGPPAERQTGGEPSASKQADGSKQPWAYG
jgi:hypothetical protein